jgi:DNA-binding transcriptional LysR family regulator
VLAAAKQAIEQAQEAAKGEIGRLVIDSIGPLTGSFLPGALARFREQRPQIEVTVHTHGQSCSGRGLAERFVWLKSKTVLL